jgi:hypothetical protein
MNVLECTQLWRDVMIEIAHDYRDVELSHMLVDNAAMQLVFGGHAVPCYGWDGKSITIPQLKERSCYSAAPVNARQPF